MGAFAEAISQQVAIPPKRVRGVVTNENSAERADDRLAESVTAEAAESFIEAKRIGERIKYLRQRKQMGLVELGRHTGLSASFLSQLETGRVVPTLRNLARIAMVFQRTYRTFSSPNGPNCSAFVRAEERQRLPQTGAEEPGYYFESLGQVPADQQIAPYVAEFLPPASGARRAPTGTASRLRGDSR
jgi:transcriptional regulator with XRE-family HTH domain